MIIIKITPKFIPFLINIYFNLDGFRKIRNIDTIDKRHINLL